MDERKEGSGLLAWGTFIGVIFTAGLGTWTNIIARETLTNTRQTEYANRYLAASQQLASDEDVARVGGLYALEQIGRESEQHVWPSVQLVMAFVVKNAPPTKRPVDYSCPNRPDTLLPRHEIQAALEVLGRLRRNKTFDCHEHIRLPSLSLAGIRLRESMDFRFAFLPGTDFREAQLGADFTDANFNGADLRCSFFGATSVVRGATLTGALLQGAHMKEAHFEGTIFTGANLENAKLDDAHLEGALLYEVDLTGASLERTHLEGAILSNAKGLTQEQMNAACVDENTRLPPGLEAPPMRSDCKRRSRRVPTPHTWRPCIREEDALRGRL